MKQKDIINELEKALNVKYAWSKSYDNGTMISEYVLYYNKISRENLAWLQIGNILDEVMSANIILNTNGERRIMNIESITDISEIVKKIID